MTKRYLFLYIAVWAGWSLSSCKKKTEETFSGSKVTTNTNYVAGYIDTYSYNSDGNVVGIQRNTGGRKVFTYSGDTITMQEITAASVISNATVYLRQGQTYADTSYGLLLTRNNSSKYSYDGNGQLTEQKNYAFGVLNSIADYTISNKNIASIVFTNPVNGTHIYSRFSFLTNVNTIGNQNFGEEFLGVGSLSAANTRVDIGVNGDTTQIISYKYHFDANSNIDLLVSYNKNGFLVDSMAFTY